MVTVNEVITEASLEMIEGQHLDVAFEGRTDIGMDGYLDMISKEDRRAYPDAHARRRNHGHR